MRLENIESKGLAHYSYYLSDAGDALVIDPRRDCETYLKLAKKDSSKIKYILETHRNEDYVIGSLELQNLTDAEIAHSKETPFKYGDHRLDDNDSLQIGNLKIKTLYTPGHTNDSLCYVLYESRNMSTPIMVFTGDTLFAGDVGRTDLLGGDKQREQSAKLFDSLQEKVLTLGNQVTVYPGHGGGSVCGHHISTRPITTIGYEKKTNLLLSMNKEQFITQLLKQKLLKPPYFTKMEQFNLEGPPLLQHAFHPQSLEANQFEEKMKETGTTIVDTRSPSVFAGSYILGSINIWLDGLSFFPGWVLSYEQKILLVTEREEDVETAKVYLWRLGFDNIVGHLSHSIESWRNNGKPIERLKIVSAFGLKQMIDRKKISVVDVRSPTEWEEGYIEGAERIYIGRLMNEVGRLPKDRPIASICSVGNRSGIGASILKKAGFKKVYNVLGGMMDWEELGYPTRRS
jgi:hydroxyacylglutathione hydrolase